MHIVSFCLIVTHEALGLISLDGFPFVMYNGVMSKRWEYTRYVRPFCYVQQTIVETDKKSRPETSFYPNYDYQGPDVICGFNGTKPLFPVKTLKVEAGSLISMGSKFMSGGDESKDFTPVSHTITITPSRLQRPVPYILVKVVKY
jgi:hypothetical protein